MNNPVDKQTQMRDKARVFPWSENRPTSNQQQPVTHTEPWNHNPVMPPNTIPTKSFLDGFLQEMKADLKSFTTTMIQQSIQASLQQFTKTTTDQSQSQLNQQQKIQQELPRSLPPEASNSLPPPQQFYYSQLYNQQYPQLQQQSNPIR